MTYRVYQHESGKMWAVKPIEGRAVSTRWGPSRPDRRLPFEKTRQGEMQSLVRSKLAKGYAYIGDVDYDAGGYSIEPGKPQPRPLHEGFALEVTAPWEMDEGQVKQIHDHLLSTLRGLAEGTDLIKSSGDGVLVGNWSLQIGGDLDFSQRVSTLLIPRDEPLPILVLAALRTTLDLRLRQGFCLSYPDGTEFPEEADQILGDQKLRNMFGLQRDEMRELLELVGLLEPPLDWSSAAASGSDWF